MVKQAVASTVDLEPIDRLEEKIRLLVEMVAQLRTEQARSTEDNTRLVEELHALRGRVADAEQAAAELAALRDERDLVRARVADMLQQLDAI